MTGVLFTGGGAVPGGSGDGDSGAGGAGGGGERGRRAAGAGAVLPGARGGRIRARAGAGDLDRGPLDVGGDTGAGEPAGALVGIAALAADAEAERRRVPGGKRWPDDGTELD